MKKLLVISILLTGIFMSSIANADVRVNGYHRKDGTYVAPHYRSDPDSYKNNNYSTKGNTNPYTGKKGYKDPYGY